MLQDCWASAGFVTVAVLLGDLGRASLVMRPDVEHACINHSYLDYAISYREAW